MSLPTDVWPLAGLRVRSGDLELRWPDEADLVALARLAAAGGIHDPGRLPFLVPWTEGTPQQVAQRTVQYRWGTWAAWEPANWELELVVAVDGTVVGAQGLSGKDFAVTREVCTGSWLGGAYQGQGIGTRMRHAVLHLAFEGLGAVSARSEAFEDSTASRRVSAKLGYRPDGFDRLVRGGAPVTSLRLRLDRQTWQDGDRPDVELLGLEPCLPSFGLA